MPDDDAEFKESFRQLCRLMLKGADRTQLEKFLQGLTTEAMKSLAAIQLRVMTDMTRDWGWKTLQHRGMGSHPPAAGLGSKTLRGQRTGLGRTRDRDPHRERRGHIGIDRRRARGEHRDRRAGADQEKRGSRRDLMRHSDAGRHIDA